MEAGVGDQIADELRDASPMLGRVRAAAERLLADEDATAAAARELVKTGERHTQRAGELAVRRAAERFLRLLP